MSIAEDFRKFIMRGNVVDLAVGVVIGGAFGKIISATVDDLIMPLVGALLPGGEWREYTLSPLGFKVGHWIGAVLDFLIISSVLFFLMVKVIGWLNRLSEKPATAPAAPTTKACPFCLENVPLAATKCRACTSDLKG